MTSPLSPLSVPATESIHERIHRVVPVTHHAYLKLLGLLEIDLDPSVPTACVTLGARSRLLLNPDFLAAHATTDEALAMLVLHELMHILLGHTRLFERATPAQNLAFDAVINAELCRRFPDPLWTALFRRLYRPDRFPEALLRPPERWGTPQVRWRLTGAAGEVHRALYEEATATCGELLDLVTRRVKGDSGQEAGGCKGANGECNEAGDSGAVDEALLGRLLGNHGDNDDVCDPELLEAVREVIARWPRERVVSGRDSGGNPTLTQLRPERPVAAVRRCFERALRHVGATGTGGGGLATAALAPLPALLPLWNGTDRRAAVAAAAGVPVLLWHTPVEQPHLEESARAHLYLDVSGSVDALLPLLYGALVPLLDRIHPQVHLFSTEVADIPVAALRRGRVASTGGTELACVLDHIAAHRVRRAVIVTDGWVEEIGEHDRRRVAGTRIAAVITPDGDDSFAAALRARTFPLPDLTPAP